MTVTTATRYHVSAAGKPAICKAASEESCPLGGQHFRTKDEAQFYVENTAPAVLRSTPPQPSFPARDDEQWLKAQVSAYWREDSSVGAATSIYSEQHLPLGDVTRERLEDYETGFETGLRGVYKTPEAAFRADKAHYYWAAGDVDEQAWQMGYRRGARLQNAKPEDFLREPIDDYDYTERTRYEQVRFLDAHFSANQKIRVPSDTYRMTDVVKDGKRTKAKVPAGSYTVQNAFRGYVDGSVGSKVHLRPTTVILNGPNRRRYEVPVTPELLAANEMPIVEVEPTLHRLIHKPINQD